MGIAPFATTILKQLGGTEAWCLVRFVGSKGLNARFEVHDGFAPGIQTPAVAGVRLGTLSRF
ncbi:MAG: hypothetical protein B7Z37_04910 [Verrucomicrobia bacterium 12-59-8]|nr:MAG: hypothetical protein B7Z37_04910 [Verrucomicrobia bacterium 12-59-8]